MKINEQLQAKKLRKMGRSIASISSELGVSKSSVSLWVREIEISKTQSIHLKSLPFTREAVEKRRVSRLFNEKQKRTDAINKAEQEIDAISPRELWLMGVMLYWAEGGKTQRMVRFSNGDPEMIKIMMRFFRRICAVPENKFRGYIHIHSHLDHKEAEKYWSEISGIPKTQFFKTYLVKNKNNNPIKNNLPNGVMDIYVLDTSLFLKISGWASGIFKKTN